MKTGRAGIVIVLIIALLATGATRQMAESMRRRTEGATASGVGSSLSAMNSFALALLLGGLRGPLVMFLWTSSEAQKTENQLESFDTKVEWIRLLQPEFDTVHIFQIWNKAYNISVKMASIANKYTTILDALEYAHKVDRERPNNINIISAIAGIFFDKFGSSAEKAQYTKRVLEETQPHKSKQTLSKADPAWRRLDLDPILDEQGRILPEYLKPSGTKLVDEKNPAEFYDGSELQFLPKYEPYPYGVSPLAIAYNYHKRAQRLQRIGKQRHAQLSDLVIDSRPALALKSWAEADWEQGRRDELEAFGKPASPTAERVAIEMLAADFSLNTPIKNKDSLKRAIYEYGRAASIARDADVEYADHVKLYQNNFALYESHREGLRGLADLAAADRDYLMLFTAPEEQKSALRQTAIDAYRKSIHTNELIMLRYYIPDPIAQRVFPTGVTRYNVQDLPAEERGPLLAKVFAFMQANQIPIESPDEIAEYQGYIARANARLKILEAK